MTTTRRHLLAGLAGLGASTALPAWAQAIRAQSDPWAQVNPYDDPKNGFPGEGHNGGEPSRQPQRRDGLFSTAPNDGGAMSEGEEIAVGKHFHPIHVREAGGAHPNQRAQQALRDFCRPMFAVADRSHLPWEVTLCNDPSPNASAFAGGKVIVNVGMFAICDRAGELAATIAHEIGHVDKRHSVRGGEINRLVAELREQGGKQWNPDVPLSALVPGSGGKVEDLLEVFKLAYSREDEAEADGHEMVIFERLGVDPIHAINDQWNFAQLGKGDVPELVRSHPRNEDRMAHIKQLAAMQKKPKQDYVFPGWDVLKTAFPTADRFKKA